MEAKKTLSPDESIQCISGIGPAKATAFAKLGITDIRSLLFHLPRGYEDRSKIRKLAEAIDGAPSSFLLTVGSQPHTARIRRGMSITKFRAFDESGSVEVVFFNQDYLRQTFLVGDAFRFTGRLTPVRRTYQLASPKFEKYDPAVPLPSLFPVYSLTEGVTTALVRKTVAVAIKETLPLIEDYLPEDIRRKYEFPTLQTAIRHLHDPENFDQVRRSVRRLAFDDYFLFSLGIALSKQKQTLLPAPPIKKPNGDRFLSLLPYKLTQAQRRACAEILSDMVKGVPMNRILVGDVGCGKTVCAAYAAFCALENGHQAAIMAPTEILARQHYGDLAPMFAALGYRTALLLGATPQKEKKAIYEALTAKDDTRIDLLIGTHALITDKTAFADLGLAVTDEQHRFGVYQRAALRDKCMGAHLLVMSATPIPRTLALVLYGDLDISRIDEMPKGRKPVATYVVDETYRMRLYAFIRKQVGLGDQVYVVCPAIEEKVFEEEEDISISLTSSLSKTPLRAAKTVWEEMTHALPDLKIGFLHGKMKSAEKDDVMHRFVDGELQVLVSTTVIEVGVNVPNATLMIVENADRFGLSQLHQLRGRVGRGEKKSYCVLVSSAEGVDAKARLETMRTTYDGYLVAEQDLKQRGPGDFLATGGDAVRQSGGLSFRFAALSDDKDLLTAAAEEAKAILSLEKEEKEAFMSRHRLLFEEVTRNFRLNGSTIS